ncbi:MULTISPECIES: pyrimidine reductase family protein [Nocardiopsis]|uniref:pyrimidine reductase family protein n=1 Tax=Nocardiopsis TaxID=2013 RepID=UPI00098932DC|nr:MULTISPECIES: pyrimidine reductase family protein [Nocardiopsis]
MAVRLLLNDTVPGAASPGDVLDASALERLYAYPDRPWLRANMVATLDGAAAGNDGRTGSINTPADQVVYTLLRDLADVVLVGAGTARVEGYRHTRPRTRDLLARAAAEGRAAHPELAVVSGTGQVPPLLADRPEDGGGVLLVTCEAAGAEALDRARHILGEDRVLVCGGQGVDLPAAVAALSGRGLPRILCEGGPRLLADVAAADLLDELCLTVVPLLAGGLEQRIAVGTVADRALVPGVVIESEGTLLQRWLRSGS